MSDSSKNANEEVVKTSKRVFEKGLHISFNPRHTGVVVHTHGIGRHRIGDPADDTTNAQTMAPKSPSDNR